MSETYPIPPPSRKEATARARGKCLWCGTAIKPQSELKDKRYYSMYFCPSNEKDCRSKYNWKFLWDNIRWRVFVRDNHTCQSCGFHPPINLSPKDDFEKAKENLEKAKYLECDHIIAVGLGGCWWDEDNLQTLCIECHRKKTKTDLGLIMAVTPIIKVKPEDRPKIIPLTKFLRSKEWKTKQ